MVFRSEVVLIFFQLEKTFLRVPGRDVFGTGTEAERNAFRVPVPERAERRNPYYQKYSERPERRNPYYQKYSERPERRNPYFQKY